MAIFNFDETKKLDAISLGEPLLEFNAREMGNLSEIKTFDRGWGGDTSNFIVAFSRLGGRVGYVTRVGSDEFGRCFLKLWEKEGIDVSRVVIEDGGFTGIYFISRKNGEHDFTYYRKDSAASHLSMKDIDVNYILSAKIFHSSGISQAISASCCEAVLYAMKKSKESNVIVSYDPNVRLKLWPLEKAQEAISKAIRLSDIVMPSLEDLRLLTNTESIEDGVKKLMGLGTKLIVVKLGEKGCLIRFKDEEHLVEGFKTKLVDTTGAGDAFDAAINMALLQGWSIKKAAVFANATAALKLKGRGAVTALPFRKEVERFLDKRLEKWRDF
ncbi:MAG: sugar kinase [Candidatus Bathyarchaeia archaeon]